MDAQPFRLDRLIAMWPQVWPGSGDSEDSEAPLQGVLLFGSRVHVGARVHGDSMGASPADREGQGDWDIGLVVAPFAGRPPGPEAWPENWDVFVWDEERWSRGFALQLELARTARILHDPLNIIQERFDFLRAEVLPRWGAYLKR